MPNTHNRFFFLLSALLVGGSPGSFGRDAIYGKDVVGIDHWHKLCSTEGDASYCALYFSFFDPRTNQGISARYFLEGPKAKTFRVELIDPLEISFNGNPINTITSAHVDVGAQQIPLTSITWLLGSTLGGEVSPAALEELKKQPFVTVSIAHLNGLILSFDLPTKSFANAFDLRPEDETQFSLRAADSNYALREKYLKDDPERRPEGPPKPDVDCGEFLSAPGAEEACKSGDMGEAYLLRGKYEYANGDYDKANADFEAVQDAQ